MTWVHQQTVLFNDVHPSFTLPEASPGVARRRVRFDSGQVRISLHGNAPGWGSNRMRGWWNFDGETLMRDQPNIGGHGGHPTNSLFYFSDTREAPASVRQLSSRWQLDTPHGFGGIYRVTQGRYVLEQWMPEPAATSISSINELTWNQARANSPIPANTGRPVSARQWRLARGASSTSVIRTIDTGAVNNVLLTGLTSSSTYRVSVRSQNATGWSPWSAWHNFTTLPGERAWLDGIQVGRCWLNNIELGSMWLNGERIWHRP